MLILLFGALLGRWLLLDVVVALLFLQSVGTLIGGICSGNNLQGAIVEDELCVVDAVLEVLVRVRKGFWDLAELESLLVGELRGKRGLLMTVWR